MTASALQPHRINHLEGMHITHPHTLTSIPTLIPPSPHFNRSPPPFSSSRMIHTISSRECLPRRWHHCAGRPLIWCWALT